MIIGIGITITIRVYKFWNFLVTASFYNTIYTYIIKKKSIIYSSKLKMITMMSDVVYLIYIYKYTTQIFNNIIYSWISILVYVYVCVCIYTIIQNILYYGGESGLLRVHPFQSTPNGGVGTKIYSRTICYFFKIIFLFFYFRKYENKFRKFYCCETTNGNIFVPTL